MLFLFILTFLQRSSASRPHSRLWRIVCALKTYSMLCSFWLNCALFMMARLTSTLILRMSWRGWMTILDLCLDTDPPDYWFYKAYLSAASRYFSSSLLLPASLFYAYGGKLCYMKVDFESGCTCYPWLPCMPFYEVPSLISKAWCYYQTVATKRHFLTFSLESWLWPASGLATGLLWLFCLHCYMWLKLTMIGKAERGGMRFCSSIWVLLQSADNFVF